MFTLPNITIPLDHYGKPATKYFALGSTPEFIFSGSEPTLASISELVFSNILLRQIIETYIKQAQNYS